MGLFKSKTTSYLGIDLGSSGIKMVELKNDKGHAKLVTYGIAESNSDVARNNSPEATKKVVKLLLDLQAKAHTTTNLAIAALPPFSVFSSIISLPPMPKSDLTQAVKWEAKKFVPMPLNEMILDWKELVDIPTGEKIDKQKTNDNLPSEADKNPAEAFKALTSRKNQSTGEKAKTDKKSGKKNHRVLITAAPKNLVSRYISIFKQANLKLVSLETESFALARSLLFSTKAPVMILDIGAVTTAISIVENGVPILNRSLDVGGNTLTQAITTSLNIDRHRAEQFKRDIGVASGNAGGGIPKVIEQTLGPIINEIKYSLNLYLSQTSQGVEQVILSGGSALLPNLVDYLSKVLDLNVYVGDPWFRVSYPEDLKVVLSEVGPRLAVSVGLAIRDIE